MCLDITGLTEAEVCGMGEAAILDLDERVDLRSGLIERLNALPEERFLIIYASCLADLRDFYGDQIRSDVLALVNRTIELADSKAAAEVLDSWNRHFGFDEDPGCLNAVGDEFETIEGACIAFAEEVAHGRNVGAAEALAHSAEQAYDDAEPGVNIRWMLRFNVRAELAG